MRALVEAELALCEPSGAVALITWHRTRVVEQGPRQSESTVAHARVARVHVGLAAQLGLPLGEALGEGRDGLQALTVFFEEDWFCQQFEEGSGRDLLYFSEVSVDPLWQGRGVALALTRRLCDALGQGCELAVVRARSEPEADEWKRLGFAPTLDLGSSQLLHLPLGSRPAEVVPDQAGGFQVVDTLSPELD